MIQTMTKRPYTRRTEEQRIQDLEAKLADVKAELESKKHKDSPLHREWDKALRSLRKFIQVASDCGRNDLALSAEAFSAGLERSIRMSGDDAGPRRRGRPSSFEDQP